MSHQYIHAGHTVYLRGGTYSGDVTCSLAGTSGNVITIKPYPGESAIIDGRTIINGNDTTWQSIEFRYSGWTTRISAQPGVPTDLPVDKVVHLYGPRTVLYRCTLHDTAGPGDWIAATDASVEECLFYNNGWDAPDRPHGHGLYIQNQIGTKTVKRCVFSPGYSGWSIHAYSESGSLAGFDVVECVSIGKTMLFGGYVPVDRLSVTRCVLWGGVLQTGYDPAQANGTATLTDTILANGAIHQTEGTWTSLTETGTDHTTGDRILTYGGLVVVFNQAGASSVAAPIAGTYKNCLNPAETITLAAGGSLPMTGWTVAAPIGAAAPLISSTFPTFGAFLVTP